MTDWIEPKTLLTPDNKQRALVDYIVKNDLLYLKDNASAVTEFTHLSDVPASYTDQGGKVVAVKEDESGLEFAAAGAGSGDMTKAVYDTDDDGKVDTAGDADTVDSAHLSDIEDTMDSKISSHAGDANSHHAQVHDIDGADHNGVDSATEDNLVAFDAAGFPKDSGHAPGDFAEAVHVHADLMALATYDSDEDGVIDEAAIPVATGMIWAIVFGG